MMWQPPCASSSANHSVFLMPCAVALRLPTIAKARDAPELSNSIRPLAYNSAGGSLVVSNADGCVDKPR